ncbi:SRPBCC family protein [Nocardioides sp.]|uniref:SRPBCC family protein n=1 Tax=Nocardioides sp. TaxID=35761 RepID=UPI00262C6A8E|nr:SRPBCC family protein [Nocardioides sp.]
MPITEVATDRDALTLTVVADYDVPVARLWDGYVDPRQLERFWGTPDWPATFLRHDAAAGGRSDYVMTGNLGQVSRGLWEWLSVDPGVGFVVRDGFALADGSPNLDLPTARMEFSFESRGSGSRLRVRSHLASAEELDSLVELGMIDGLRAAMGQIDGVLALPVPSTPEDEVLSQTLTETQIRVSRVLRSTVEQVWEAHHDSSLMRTWLLGPEGWTMPVCQIATDVGEGYQYEWEPIDPTSAQVRFGFVGTLVEEEAPYRSVTTEAMIGLEGPATLNEMTLTALEHGTLLSLVITYPSEQLRDIVLQTGMTEGMEASYRRLDQLF